MKEEYLIFKLIVDHHSDAEKLLFDAFTTAGIKWWEHIGTFQTARHQIYNYHFTCTGEPKHFTMLKLILGDRMQFL